MREFVLRCGIYTWFSAVPTAEAVGGIWWVVGVDGEERDLRHTRKRWSRVVGGIYARFLLPHS